MIALSRFEAWPLSRLVLPYENLSHMKMFQAPNSRPSILNSIFEMCIHSRSSEFDKDNDLELVLPR